MKRNALLAGGIGCLALLGVMLPSTLFADESVLGVNGFSFGRIKMDQVVEQVIAFDNPTDRSIEIKNIQLTPPLLVRDIKNEVEPGGRGQFTLIFGEDRRYGEYEGFVRVNFTDTQVAPVEFNVRGYIIPPIEILPRPVFFTASYLGKPKTASLEIINHKEKPLDILRMEHESKRFTLQLDTLEPGQRYKLTLKLIADEPGPKQKDWIHLIINDPKNSKLSIQANTWIRDRVYTFPELVNMGGLPFSVALNQKNADRFAQTLMIYRPETSDFEVSASTDLDFLRIQSERGPKGDRYQLTLTLISEKLRPGEIKGSITFKTNDSKIPELIVPVTGNILDQ